jgi:hypothetical protein
MSAAACKIIICSAKLQEECANTLIATHEDAADEVIALLEKATRKVKKLREG